MSLFCYITHSFLYRRNDVSFKLQLIWGDAIFVEVVAVSFSLSFVARIVLTENNCMIRFLQSNQFSLMKKFRVWEPSKTILLLQLTIALFVFITICIFRKYLHGHKPSNKNFASVKIKVFAEQIVTCTGSQQRWIKNVSLAKLGVPKFSLAMYPFSISTDERVPLKLCFSNFLFHRLSYTLDTSFAPPKPDKTHTR